MTYKQLTKLFQLKDIFRFERGKCNDSVSLVQTSSNDKNAIAYIGAKKDDNGVMFFVKNEDDTITSKGNGICFICQGEGSNGYNNYFNVPTIQTSSNIMGYNEHLNVYNGLFLVTLLDLQKQLFCFGRGRSKVLADTWIELPIKKNDEGLDVIDWDFMTNFMKKILKEQWDKLFNKDPLKLND